MGLGQPCKTHFRLFRTLEAEARRKAPSLAKPSNKTHVYTRYCFTTKLNAFTDDGLLRALKLNMRRLPLVEKRTQRGDVFARNQLAPTGGRELASGRVARYDCHFCLSLSGERL